MSIGEGTFIRQKGMQAKVNCSADVSSLRPPRAGWHLPLPSRAQAAEGGNTFACGTFKSSGSIQSVGAVHSPRCGQTLGTCRQLQVCSGSRVTSVSMTAGVHAAAASHTQVLDTVVGRDAREGDAWAKQQEWQGREKQSASQVGAQTKQPGRTTPELLAARARRSQESQVSTPCSPLLVGACLCRHKST